MNRRNVSIVALLWAAAITGIFFFFPSIFHSDTSIDLHLPMGWLMALLSWGDHSPSVAVIIASYIIYTVFYWLVFVIIYAIILDFYLAFDSKASLHLESSKEQLMEKEFNNEEALNSFGAAVRELETRRRHHFLLKHLDFDDLENESNQSIAIKSLSEMAERGPIKRLQKHLKNKLEKEVGLEQAEHFMSNLNK
jgi:hypothetical protein